ncbi:L-threonylcarbamoyladenylate synthase [Haloprofundus halophilus]|uniref:L-threonylcarbamoyladenylate synthase n=1 Tax=Haloprofundus halophilus TaxID=2283527 RepID=UPI000E4303AF|nr:L-threonylcarbamoyladenylate synthase [Haloprofundus halophilus]
MDTVADAVAAVERGEAVVYPTETVYGLGADALDADAVERVFELKGRARDKPLSLGAPSVDAALSYIDPTDREIRFMREFLPGPVTVVTARREVVPDALTAGRERVGIRVPDHDLALELLSELAPTPLTATSANRSGAGSVRRIDELDSRIRDAVGAVLDDGEAPGAESTVVDVGENVVHRRGARADDIEAWLKRE